MLNEVVQFCFSGYFCWYSNWIDPAKLLRAQTAETLLQTRVRVCGFFLFVCFTVDMCYPKSYELKKVI